MSEIYFGEKAKEYSPKHQKDLPVWQSPKYIESKAKAIEIIESQRYGVLPSDFWILMNVTKNEKMAYTGLIISHNGCLKINDRLESKFDPACVQLDKEGYKGSLVYTYCNPAQGLYEVGEVNASNCKNEYPYAMAYKRLFDRVVLKLSKLAYAGIYSDSEADEFTQRVDAPVEPEQPKTKPQQRQPKEQPYVCSACGQVITDYNDDQGRRISAKRHAEASLQKHGQLLCVDCIQRKQSGDLTAAFYRAEEYGVPVNRA